MMVHNGNIWGFPMGVPQYGWFLWTGKSHLEMDDWGVALFQEPPYTMHCSQFTCWNNCIKFVLFFRTLLSSRQHSGLATSISCSIQWQLQLWVLDVSNFLTWWINKSVCFPLNRSPIFIKLQVFVDTSPMKHHKNFPLIARRCPGVSWPVNSSFRIFMIYLMGAEQWLLNPCWLMISSGIILPKIYWGL